MEHQLLQLYTGFQRSTTSIIFKSQCTTNKQWTSRTKPLVDSRIHCQGMGQWHLPLAWGHAICLLGWQSHCTTGHRIFPLLYGPWSLPHSSLQCGGSNTLSPKDWQAAFDSGTHCNSGLTTRETFRVSRSYQEWVLKSWYASNSQFEKENAKLIVNYHFKEGAPVLARNSSIDTNLSRKTKPHHLRPLIVICHTRNKAYILSEPDGIIHKNPYAAFCLIPYYPCSCTLIPVTFLIMPEDMSWLSEDQVNWGQSTF